MNKLGDYLDVFYLLLDAVGYVSQEFNVVINVYVVKILLKLLWKHIQ